MAPVREHPAPSGALRPENDDVINIRPRMVREHPAPSGALRHEIPVVVHERLERSGSTQRHQVHSRPCSKGAGRGPLPKCRGQRSAGAAVVPHAGAPSALLLSPSAVKCAHKGPELGNAVRTQGWNQAVVCGVVLRNFVPCVRNRELRAKGGTQRHRVH